MSRGDASWRTSVAGCAVLVVAFAALLTGCSGDEGDAPGKLDVVASTDVWGSVAELIGGSQVSVVSVIDEPDQDPHSYEASARVLLDVRNADLIVENGGGYDDFISQMVESAGSAASVVNAMTISDRRAKWDPDGNEHLWYDLDVVNAVAGAVANRLGHLDPGHAVDFQNRLIEFRKTLNHLRDLETQVRERDGGLGVAVTEPLPLLMLRALDLHNLTPPEFSSAIEESGDVAPRVLKEMLDLFHTHQVAVLFDNAQTSGPVTEQVKVAAVDANIPVVAFTETLPEGLTYLTWMARNLHLVAEALDTQ